MLTPRALRSAPFCALAAALFIISSVGATLVGPATALADSAPRTIVLPFRSIGVSDTTVVVSRDLLIGSLQDLGVAVAEPAATEAPLPSGAAACDDAACAQQLGLDHQASQVIYGSLSRLGTRIIARLDVLRAGESTPYYRDQLSATSEEDLERVMRRFAEGIAAGRPNSDRASVESVTNVETLTPARRASHTGFGLRAGFLFPTAGSFGGTDRLTNVHGVFKYELRDFQIETTTLGGFSWGEGNFDWTILDMGVSRIFGAQDFSPYAGASIGVHSVTVVNHHSSLYVYTDPYSSYTYSYWNDARETRTAPTLDVFAGLIALRTYDFQTVLEVRLHYVFDKFDQAGGKGANGILISFGTSH